MNTVLNHLEEAFISCAAVFNIYLPSLTISKRLMPQNVSKRRKKEKKDTALSQWASTLKHTSTKKYSIFSAYEELHLCLHASIHDLGNKKKIQKESRLSRGFRQEGIKEHCHIIHHLPPPAEKGTQPARAQSRLHGGSA